MLSAKDLATLYNNPQDNASFLVVIAPDRLRPQRALSHILNTLNGKKEKVLLERLKGESLNVESLSDFILTRPFGYSRRLLFITDGDLVSADVLKALKKIYDKSVLPNLLILTLQSEKIPKTFILKLPKIHQVLHLPPMEKEELTRWALKEFLRLGIKELEKEILPFLIDVAQNDVDQLALYIEQASLSGKSASQLSLTEVKNLFKNGVDQKLEFAIIDAVINGDKLLVERLLAERNLMNNRSNFHGMIALLYRVFSSLLLVKSGGTSKAPEWLQKKERRQASKFSIDGLTSRVKSLCDIDVQLKQKSVGDEVVLAKLCTTLSP